MQLGSSSQSGRNLGAAVEADAIREQQLKQTQSETGIEADVIGEQQLSAQRAVRCRISHVGE